MVRVFRAEWLRLRQPLLLGGSTAGVAGFGVLIAAVTFLLSARNGTTRGFNNRLRSSNTWTAVAPFAAQTERISAAIARWAPRVIKYGSLALGAWLAIDASSFFLRGEALFT